MKQTVRNMHGCINEIFLQVKKLKKTEKTSKRFLIWCAQDKKKSQMCEHTKLGGGGGGGEGKGSSEIV